MRKRALSGEAKRDVLSRLDSSLTPLSIPELAEGFEQQIGSLYVYCARLKRQGLIRAFYDYTGRLRYELTRKGRGRLAWLKCKHPAKPS